MNAFRRIAALAVLALWVPPALADGIEPGLWRIVSQIEANGMRSPPQQSRKCFTPEQARDLVKTFTPVPRMVNSECAPVDASFEAGRLTWKLTCKGQLDMEVTGDYAFRDGRQYAAVIRNRSALAGMPASESVTTLMAERVADCP